MATLKDIKRRIQSVDSTAKITNAMKLVSAAKFARASHAVNASRPYSAAFEKMVSRVLAGCADNPNSPLLRDERKFGKTLLVVVSTDRGLCGGLNNNIFKNAEKWLKAQASAGETVEILAWGRRAKSFSNKRPEKRVGAQERVLEKPTYDGAQALVGDLIEKFSNEYDRIFLAYSEFQSALTQQPVLRQLLPAVIESKEEVSANYIVEPSLDSLLQSVLEKRLIIAVFQAMLEGAASEHGARMSAMDSATRNAKEVKQKLQVQYNRARQAAITNELIEIISGAEAL